MSPAVVDLPPSRRLRVYAFDPSLAQQIETADIHEIIIRVPWEKLEPGPIGEYIEVIDVDPPSDVAYPPVDLDDPNLLAQDGLAPSESVPQFHQQMVYAVAMATIGHFERALGRVALWGPYQLDPARSPTKRWHSEFVRRLRIYPHALRDQNAYYSPDKKALLFGYFPVTGKDEYNTPGTTVFACLSHDIVAHETTHALLDGVHPRFNEPSNPDVLAFHEAFADIVALFQHFSYPGVLRNQIAKTRGEITSENLLGQLAQQFGRATGSRSALRDALGDVGDDDIWRARKPDPKILETEMEPHARGAILVNAIFGAFVLVYRKRTRDLFRLATQGTGVLPEGEIHPDLAKRLADEASRVARDILQMAIRGIDYCPPVGITFGDYLRAVVTGDVNLNPEDEFGYRVALVESFRQWGIYPRGIRSMSPGALVWPSGTEVIADARNANRRAGTRPSEKEVRQAEEESREAVRQLFGKPHAGRARDRKDDRGRGGEKVVRRWDLSSDRHKVWKNMDDSCIAVWRWLHNEGREYADVFGIVLNGNAPKTVYRSKATGRPSVEVHSVRTALRRDSRGATVTDVVIEIHQRRRGFFDPVEQKKGDRGSKGFGPENQGDFKYRAGCTIVIDATENVFRHIIRTPGDVANNVELERMRAYVTGEVSEGDTNSFDGRRMASLSEPQKGLREPFALLHRAPEDGPKRPKDAARREQQSAED